MWMRPDAEEGTSKEALGREGTFEVTRHKRRNGSVGKTRQGSEKRNIHDKS